MATPERIYLFHGSDALASSAGRLRWESAYRKKYAESSLHIVNADELNDHEFRAQITRAAEVQGLFAETVLLVIKRTCHKDKALAGALAKELISFLDQQLTRNDENLTILIWEEKRLADEHALMKWFIKNQGKAAVKVFEVLSGAKLLDHQLASLEITLTPPVRQKVLAILQEREKMQRIQQRLKSQQLLQTDDRPWWLSMLLTNASLLSPDQEISVETLEQLLENEPMSVSVFECINAFERQQWDKLRGLLRQWELAEADDSSYFSLYALLRRAVDRLPQALAYYADDLLAQIELASKNGILNHAELLDLFVLRLANFSGEQQPLLSEKTLWLAAIARS